jgi:hypothetical protein
MRRECNIFASGGIQTYDLLLTLYYKAYMYVITTTLLGIAC